MLTLLKFMTSICSGHFLLVSKVTRSSTPPSPHPKPSLCNENSLNNVFRRVGIIEWMKNTTPLKDFLKGDNEMTNNLRAGALHNEWLKKNYEKYTVMYK